ncbi:dienelactone hydrolase family protein [Streptomyces sp. NPDC054956]
MTDHDLAGCEQETFTHEGVRRRILRRGGGPPRVVIGGITRRTPHVGGVAGHVAALGGTAGLPRVFGEPGRDPHPDAHGAFGTARYAASSVLKVCVSREFTVLATGRSSRVTTWLRALAAHEHERCGGPGVGAVGMCMTGGFALAMATDPRLVAPVLSQPSLPVAVSAGRSRTIDISPEELAVVRGRCEREGLQVMGLRFKGDKFVPGDRFAFLKRELGDAFVAVELDDAAANPDGVLPPHSVLTEHLIDSPGEPTRDALDQVLGLFRTRLLSAEASRGA